MKIIRKLTIGFCALVLVLGMAAAVNAASATITIPNAVAGQTYDAYRVFDYTPTEEGGYYTLSSKFAGFPSYTYSYNNNSVAMSSFFTVGENDILNTSGLAKEDDFNLFAKAVVAFAEGNGIANDGSTTAAEDGVATISVGEEGFYVVRSSLGNKVSYNYVLNGGAEIEEKNNIPSIDMKVTGATNSSAVYSDKTGNDAQIGDIVEFEITADLKEGGRDYAIVDVLTPGLTLQDLQDSNISFSNGGPGYTIDNAYVDENGNKGFKITFDGEPAKDTTVTVDWYAVVNKNAVIAAGENINETFLIYGNGTETTHVTTKTMTYPLQLKKISEGDASEEILPGAKFQIIRELGNVPVKFTKISDTEYKVDPEGTVTEIETVVDTPPTLLGLGPEDYVFVETIAPQGYNLLGSSVSVDGTEYKHAQRGTVSTTSTTSAVQIEKIEDPKADEIITIDGVKYTLNNKEKTATVSGHNSELPALVEIPSSVSYDDKNYTVTSIGQDAFLYCDSLESVSIPASVESIGQGAFYSSGVKSVTIEENSKLKNIGNAAFYGCDSLESISIPASVESIEESAFCNCTGLKTVAFAENSKLKSIELNTFESCKSLESVSIPASVESIGEGAFCGCENLESVSIPASVESIGESAFRSCTSLKSVSIPASVESIGESAFYYCTSLSSITIPASATSIDGLAFFRCEALTIFNYLGSKAQWEAIRDTLHENGKLLVQDGEDIIFKNSDGTELQYSSVKSGLTPQYVGATPTKDADDQYTYTFAGWDPEITEVTGTATYTAKYNSQAKGSSIQGANVVLSATAFTYNGKVQKPSVVTVGGMNLTEGTDFTVQWSNAKSKNVGPYTVTITGIGNYTGVAKATYKINPKGTTLKKPKKDKKAVTVKWKKQKAKMSKARITGYQIQIATNKKFTKNKKTVTVKGYKKTSKKIKKLKSEKKYYVHVRTYKTIKGVKYYSPWSAVKTVTTK